MSTLYSFATLRDITNFLRDCFEEKKSAQERTKGKNVILLFAYNGTGKTRLSMDFKDAGKTGEQGDTLYFNAFTEDLFFWDNDLENDTHRKLRLNQDSRFFAGLRELEMETRIRPFLHRYADFDFSLDTERWEVSFSREEDDGRQTEDIKISRGEERLFIWCFFLAIVQLVLDDAEAYGWVRYIYIDDPMSSLDDNRAIAIGSDFAAMFRERDNKDIKLVVSSHHALFFNVLHNEFYARERREKVASYLLEKRQRGYSLKYANETPFLSHIAMLRVLLEAEKTGELYTYHFNILRNLLEKTAHFHGFTNFSACFGTEIGEASGNDEKIYARMVNILSHGNYSLFEPREMVPENKEYFSKILAAFLKKYTFNETELRDDGDND